MFDVLVLLSTLGWLVIHKHKRQKGYMVMYTTTAITTVLRPFVRDYRRNTHHPLSWSSPNLYQLLPSTTIHSILPVQIACLAMFFAQLLSMSSLVYLLVWSPPPHIPYISSPNQCLFSQHILFIYFYLLCVKKHHDRRVMWQWCNCENTCTIKTKPKLECGPMPNLMVALRNTGGALCSTPQSLADAHY